MAAATYASELQLDMTRELAVEWRDLRASLLSHRALCDGKVRVLTPNLLDPREQLCFVCENCDARWRIAPEVRTS